MVQLYVYEGSTRYELDLYPTDPIKINLQIEDVIDIDRVESAYSQSFRIPATQNNSKFFKWWYEMSTVDFDITKVVRGEIHSDGLIYMSGELRLQAAYINGESNNVDLEILFMGNTRDFATQISEIYMNQLNDLAQYNHELTYNDGVVDGTLEDSWNGNLFNGFIRYALADRGNDFTDDGFIQFNQAEVVSEQNHNDSFQKQSHPLKPQQFTPVLRVKEIVDSIFSLTDYDYTDDSFFSDTSTYWPLVQNLYTDGLPGETAEIVYLEGNIEVAEPQNNIALGTESRFRFTIEQVDPSNAWNQNTDEYTAQGDETALDLRVNLLFAWSGDNQFPGPLTIKVFKTVNGIPTIIDIDTVNANQVNMTYNYVYDSVLDPINNPPIAIDAGEKIYITYEITGQTERGAAFGTFTTENGISVVSVPNLLKDDVLILDFLKDILLKFRLVMAPTINEPYKFTIKPWVDYIGSGDTVDWTYKLDNTKDVVVKPIFFDQSQDILFTDTEDSDTFNQLYQDTNNLIFGEYLYDGENELITGRREVKPGIAPTPISRVNQFPGSSNFIIPQFNVVNDEINNSVAGGKVHFQRVPMRPKTRLLFWNGMKTINNGETWWYGAASPQLHYNMSTYPAVSYATEIPNTPTTLNLNWSLIDTYIENVNTLEGQSVYDRYWYDYIQSLYSKDARKFTAYFILDSQDLRNIAFNNYIFIENNYYRISKVYNAVLDGIAPVKVDLIKVLN